MYKDPYAEYLGMTLEKVDPGYARASMKIEDHLLNFHGTANGGAIFSLADFVFAVASNSHGQAAVGITMTMHYMAAGQTGELLTATAKEEKEPTRLGLYRIEVKNESDDLVALAEGMVYRKKSV
ncbi:MAG TPA: hydroxyphenylacetyl-CoA thioesterase PaaI [Bacillales bacterium]|nr:hydroxyphenylacetyl-CoA thioesterase PaaI [Bacillales bacterium]